MQALKPAELATNTYKAIIKADTTICIKTRVSTNATGHFMLRERRMGVYGNTDRNEKFVGNFQKIVRAVFSLVWLEKANYDVLGKILKLRSKMRVSTKNLTRLIAEIRKR